MLNLAQKSDMRLLALLAEEVRLAGSDHLPLFGGLYEGGYCIQQVPAELARLVALLSAHEPFHHSLEIGIAAGGTTRFIREFVEIEHTAIIDDGKHHNHHHWEANKRGIPNLREFIGDSHSPGAEQFLEQHGFDHFDLVGIDADHSYEGVRADWKMVEAHLVLGAFVWFHDIVACAGVKELWNELKLDGYDVMLETDALGIGVIRYGSKC